MAKTKPLPGRGRKRPQFNIPTVSLLLDPLNPRLPRDAKGKKQEEILVILKRDFDLDELALSIAANGYFDEEPMVAIPVDLPKIFENKSNEELQADGDYRAFLEQESTFFHVVEGNRRLSTIKLLLSSQERAKLKIRNWPDLSDEAEEDISTLPVIVYPTRKEVLPYLGVRHITGILKWEPYAKAVYIADMIDQGYLIDEVQKQVGDRSNNVKRNYLSYKIIEEAEKVIGLDTDGAKGNFSLMTLATGLGSIKTHLGLPTHYEKTNFDQPVPEDKLGNLKEVIGWIFGEGDKLPVIKDSRDITDYLTPVLANAESLAYLRETGDLLEAYERSGGEENLIIKKLGQAKRALKGAVGLVSSNKSTAVRKLLDECEQSIKDMRKLLK